ncbi:hypothetical protein NEOLEDRAFT_1166477 [Neolentinus lepideus HHB14362 ss-1]|uniref:Uncharacterized protein n=1 Tax=Neolentinus lepideus HHB14362 ss-1 TaxID=1314782 RepID=A0A165VVN9_9AGAM|nr:hypothetical protein NEOLEDRAFT_1166477 [Neolentinus lepideus HHB14362 ss-1]
MRAVSFLTAVTLVIGAVASPIYRRANVSNVQCTDPNTTLDSHTTNVAILAICGGIAGTIEKCQGAPTNTTGQSGDVRFTLTPTVAGATINISKGRWEQGVKAAFAQCGQDKPFTAVIQGGASSGDVAVKLEQV